MSIKTNTIAWALAAAASLCALGAGPTGPRFATVAASPPGALQDGAGIVWWNEEWCKLLGLEGAWEARTSGDVVRLRPEYEGCSLTILSVLTGQVTEYAMPARGEVVLAHGWVMIDRTERGTFGRFTAGPPADMVPPCNTDYMRTRIEKIVWSGDGWVGHQPQRGAAALVPADEADRVDLAILGAAGGDEPTMVQVHLRSGRVFEHRPAGPGPLWLLQIERADRSYVLVCEG